MTVYQNMNTGHITTNPSGPVESLYLFDESNRVNFPKYQKKVARKIVVPVKMNWGLLNKQHYCNNGENE